MKMLFLVVAFNLLFSISAFAQDLPEQLMYEIGKAMTDGAALYKAYLESPVTGKNVEKPSEISGGRTSILCVRQKRKMTSANGWCIISHGGSQDDQRV